MCISSRFQGSLKLTIVGDIYTTEMGSCKSHLFLQKEQVVKHLQGCHWPRNLCFKKPSGGFWVLLSSPPQCLKASKTQVCAHFMNLSIVPGCDKSIIKGTIALPPGISHLPPSVESGDRGWRVTLESLFWSPHPALLKRGLICKQRFQSCESQQAKNSPVLTTEQIEVCVFFFLTEFIITLDSREPLIKSNPDLHLNQHSM